MTEGRPSILQRAEQQKQTKADQEAAQRETPALATRIRDLIKDHVRPPEEDIPGLEHYFRHFGKNSGVLGNAIVRFSSSRLECIAQGDRGPVNVSLESSIYPKDGIAPDQYVVDVEGLPHKYVIKDDEGHIESRTRRRMGPMIVGGRTPSFPVSSESFSTADVADLNQLLDEINKPGTQFNPVKHYLVPR